MRKGIVWPEPIAPFDVSLIPINMQKSPRVQEIAERLYAELTAAGFDARARRPRRAPGVKFADDELLGIPHRIVIGDKGLDRGVLEYKRRRDGDARGRARSTTSLNSCGRSAANAAPEDPCAGEL